MIVDLLRPEAASLPPAEIVVVGAGAVGLMLALELADRGRKVLLLESGGLLFEAQSQELNLAESAGRPHEGLHNGRARVFGGTTSLWGGQLVPLSPIDLEPRAWAPHSGWPIGYDDLAPWYDAVFARLGMTAQIDPAVWGRAGLSDAGEDEACRVILTRWLREPNFKKLFEGRVRRHPDLTCALHAHTVGLLRDRDVGAVAGVVVARPDGTRLELRAPRVVLANGTIEQVRLMLACAMCEPEVPFARSPWLGAGFHDHLDGIVAQIRPSQPARLHTAFDNIYWKNEKLQPKIVISDDRQRSERMLNIAASFTFQASVQEHLVALRHAGRAVLRGAIPEAGSISLSGMREVAKLLYPMARRYLVERRAFNPADRGIFLNVHAEQIPIRESRIVLAQSRLDRFGTPGVRLEWRVHGAELESIARFAELVAGYLAREDLGILVPSPGLFEREARVLDRLHDANHQAGGLRMARSVDEGVVDRDLQVFGVANLFIAGASVFPTGGYANSTLTAMALGLRLAAHLAS